MREEILHQKLSENQEIETVCVPKERYEKLIDIYSWNVAEITVSQMHRTMNSKEDDVTAGSSINYME